MLLKGEGIAREFIRVSGGSNRFTAVQDTDIELHGGQLTVLSGRSGSGKTTLLNMLSGLLPPTRGRVLLDGEDIYSLNDAKLSRLRNRKLGVVPQGQTAIHSLTVRENILLPCTLYGNADAADEEYAASLMERLDIAALASVRPAELSGGELRRMAIARAMIRHPEVIFADEPTGDLDDENTAVVFEFLRSAAGDGAAVLVVSHEAAAADYADRRLTMTKGEIAEM